VVEDGDWIPTRRLLNLAAESRFEQERQRDKKLHNGNNLEDLNEFDDGDLDALD
jgi:hypothetical protein